MDLAPPPTQCPFLVRALTLLETEPGLRGSPERDVLMQSLADLEREAIAAGAEERSLKAIQSARAIVDFDRIPTATVVHATA